MKEGSFESILRHQITCRACDQCEFLCHDHCNEYFANKEMEDHREDIRLNRFSVVSKKKEEETKEELNRSGSSLDNTEPIIKNQTLEEIIDQAFQVRVEHDREVAEQINAPVVEVPVEQPVPVV